MRVHVIHTLVAAAILSLGTCQNYSTSGPLSISINEVPLSIRVSWCGNQTSSCYVLCGDGATVNICNSDYLTFECMCSNGPQYNFSDYRNTIPYYICHQWKKNCIGSTSNNTDGRANCHSATCPTKIPTWPSHTSSAGSSSSSDYSGEWPYTASAYSSSVSYDYTTDDSGGLSSAQTAGVVLGTLTGIVALVGGVMKCYYINKIEELQRSTRETERELAERARERMERGEASADYTTGVDGSANAIQTLTQPDGSQGASAAGGGGGA